jgi:hypothetical protein
VNPSKRQIKSYPNALLNPDFSKVSRAKPHFWKVNDKGELVTMTISEQKARLAHIAQFGLDNAIVPRGSFMRKLNDLAGYFVKFVYFVFQLALILYVFFVIWVVHKEDWAPIKMLWSTFFG